MKITHPERIVYASAGISKGQVVEYYRVVAPWMLDELKGRALSLLRCPQGAAIDFDGGGRSAPSTTLFASSMRSSPSKGACRYAAR